MNRYAPVVEAAMVKTLLSLGERERRLYAAAEAIKLGRGAGVTYLARLLIWRRKSYPSRPAVNSGKRSGSASRAVP